jgi:LmbE family N-acetylglucosaminyl deacetylase
VPSRRLLFSLAHPDDESFGSGGTIARYVDEGAEVYYICATNGDVGTVAPEMLNGYNSVAELRLAELDKASAILGFKKVFKLGFKDSGMMNSETSKDPACLWQAPREVVAKRVVEVIREVKPQVVVTFNKYGGYGHPDHIAIQRATTDAFNLAGDASYETGQAPYQPQKLYYTNTAKFMLRLALLNLRLRGINPREVGKNKDIDMLAILENIEPLNTRIDVRRYFDTWEAASACHASQLGGGPPRMPNLIRRTLTARQGFTRIHPAPRYNRIDENDLFAGVQPDEV